MDDMINISVGNATLAALLGYFVVFVGLIFLMLVVMLLGRIMVVRSKKAAAVAAASAAPAPTAPAAPAVGTAGDLKLYDTDPRDAAMVMAIVADTLGKPLNELRFVSIKEVKKDEI